MKIKIVPHNEGQTPPQHSKVYIKRTISFKTSPAMRVVTRSLARASYALFSISIILPLTLRDRAKVEEQEQLISDEFKNHIDDFVAERQRLIHKLEALEVTQLAEHTRIDTIEVEIDSPKTSQFIALIELLDDIVVYTENLWLLGEISDNQRKNAIHIWTQRLHRLASSIIATENALRNEAKNQGKGLDVDKAAPEFSAENDIDSTDATSENA